jgi:uncharacterized protein (TIGR02246 family)
MNAIDKLVALEEIRALMARRVRCLDEKDWAGFADCYAEDAVSYSFVRPEAPEDKIVGAKEIAARVAKALEGVTTAHQIHLPEIEILSEDHATGIFPLNDVLSRMREGKRHWMRGYGHYRQVYRKVDGRWLIQEHRLTRLLLETGVEEPA